MIVNMTQEQFRRLILLIAQHADVHTVQKRQSLLEEADLAEFIHRVNIEGETQLFSQEIVRKLQDFGTLKRTGQPAFVSLLRVIRERVAGHEEDAAFIDYLLGPFTSQPQPASSPVNNNGTVRILFLAANPVKTPALRLGAEVRTIEERLQEAKLRDRFVVHQAHAVRWTDLSKYLLEHDPHIIHFAGHGTHGSEIVLEDDQGNSQVIPADTLSDLFRILKKNIRCVVLNACWSEVQARAIIEYIDAVIGMSMPISDDAAHRFAAGLYRGIGFGQSLKTAFELGCNELSAISPSEKNTPQLLLHDGLDPDKMVF
jgi:hypothetical protein